ncbi:hypothetical protein ZWY2020_022542 [Hordeum vulgare]|nr:hypothetical protein ZWY2020_022542 [Hordeum vulgare]
MVTKLTVRPSRTPACRTGFRTLGLVVALGDDPPAHCGWRRLVCPCQPNSRSRPRELVFREPRPAVHQARASTTKNQTKPHHSGKHSTAVRSYSVQHKVAHLERVGTGSGGPLRWPVAACGQSSAITEPAASVPRPKQTANDLRAAAQRMQRNGDGTHPTRRPRGLFVFASFLSSPSPRRVPLRHATRRRFVSRTPSEHPTIVPFRRTK